ncbi:MAG: hypothetical protein KF889_30395 [Alphaproteobacteria bacterium]|nr:hypothetical protein [Alphaproteobacteria bacterium]MCW5739702.1 hypothetical protein [Alphaproteobacteria bacterium]
MSAGDPVPAITEAEATGDIAALYADIRATLGVGVVNLIWRHLATIDGALPWAWSAVRPLYAEGIIEGEAERLRERMRLLDLPRVPPEVLVAVGLDATALAGVKTVLATYDISNTMNLLALSALQASLEGNVVPGAQLATGRVGGAGAAMPKLLSEADVSPQTWALVLRLNMLGERDEGRVLASMYRHLAHWPGVLGVVWALLAPADSDGSLSGAIADNLATAKARASVLAGRLRPADLPAGERAAAHKSIALFVDHPIGKMSSICRMLRLAIR